jgi:coenzyme F420-reducing hydrogenase delta subunit
MSWEPRILVFQCQYCLFTEVDQGWMNTQLPPHIKLIKVPCTGRISPLFLLNAVQGGADGILVSGCMPENCHFKEGNLAARRQLDEFARFLSYLGMEEERLRFAWIDLEEQGRIQAELADLTEQVRSIGPAQRLVTRPAQAVGTSP